MESQIISAHSGWWRLELDRQTDRQSDWQTDRQMTDRRTTDRQTDRQTTDWLKVNSYCGSYEGFKVVISGNRKFRCVRVTLEHERCFQIILSTNNLKLLPSGLALKKNLPITLALCQQNRPAQNMLANYLMPTIPAFLHRFSEFTAPVCCLHQAFQINKSDWQVDNIGWQMMDRRTDKPE